MGLTTLPKICLTLVSWLLMAKCFQMHMLQPIFKYFKKKILNTTCFKGIHYFITMLPYIAMMPLPQPQKPPDLTTFLRKKC